jgi:hypothetical protein
MGPDLPYLVEEAINEDRLKRYKKEIMKVKEVGDPEYAVNFARVCI